AALQAGNASRPIGFHRHGVVPDSAVTAGGQSSRQQGESFVAYTSASRAFAAEEKDRQRQVISLVRPNGKVLDSFPRPSDRRRVGRHDSDREAGQEQAGALELMRHGVGSGLRGAAWGGRTSHDSKAIPVPSKGHRRRTATGDVDHGPRSDSTLLTKADSKAAT